MKLFAKFIGLLLGYELLSDLFDNHVKINIHHPNDFDYSFDEFDDIVDDDDYPGYGTAIEAISKSDMFSVHKRNAIVNIPTDATVQFYRGIASVAQSDMFSVQKMNTIIEMSRKFK